MFCLACSPLIFRIAIFRFFSFLLNNYTVLYQFVSEDLAGVLHVYLYGFGVTTHKTDKTDFGYQMLIEGLKKIFKLISLWLHLGLSLSKSRGLQEQISVTSLGTNGISDIWIAWKLLVV